MAHRSLRALPFLAALALACEPDRTAIVLEAVNEAAEPLEEVVFRVSGPGLDGGAQEARAPVAGPEACPFPLTLVLVGGAQTMAGPYEVKIEGRRDGHAVAQAVRTGGDGPVAFSPGEVVRYQFALRPLASTDATPPPMAAPPPMTAPPPADAGACNTADTCGGDRTCECAPGCACRFTCGADHCVVRCEGAGTSCQVEVAGAQMVNVDCSGGAACLVRGSPDKKEVHFGCAGSKPLECGNDTRACNRDCP